MQDDLLAYGQSLALRSRALGDWAERWAEIHLLTEELLRAPRGSVFLRDSATAVTAAIAASIEPHGERRRVLIGSGDFHSIRYLWSAQVRRGFEIVEVESNGARHADAESFVPKIDERISVVALSLVSPRSGALLDVRAIVDAARRAGALVIIDAYQAVGVVPIDVKELGADAVVGGFHKWVGGGGTGLAFGYLAPTVSAKLQPAYPGWLGHARLFGFDDTFEATPDATKFQQGMPAMEPVYTSRAGIRWILATGIDAIRRRNAVLTDRIVRRSLELGLPVRTPIEADQRGPMVCFGLSDGERIVKALADDGIDIDHRPGAGIRVGPHPCSTEEECDLLIERLARYA